MAMVRCDADEHFYDDSKHSSCPFCGSSRGEDEKTVFVPPKISRDDEKTKIVDSFNWEPNSHIMPNSEIQIAKEETTEKTIAPWQRKKVASTQNKVEAQDKSSEFSGAPVVGWLVIVDGNHKGEDYKIIPGINTIGRDHNNTIVISNEDQEISREKHCIIEFDTKNKKFYVERGSTTTYLNDSRVGGDGTELSARDIIEMGSTKLQFIPFCSAEFCWDL